VPMEMLKMLTYYMGIVRNSEYRYSTDGGSVDV